MNWWEVRECDTHTSDAPLQETLELAKQLALLLTLDLGCFALEFPEVYCGSAPHVSEACLDPTGNPPDLLLEGTARWGQE